MRVLLIEDNRELNDATALQLRKEGYEVDACFDGDEGLYYMLEGMYDIVLLDRMLPGLNGIEILQAARKKGITSPVLLLTALGSVHDRVDGLDAGADDYLIKPFAISELLARMRALTRRPNQLIKPEELHYADLVLDADALTLEGGLGRCTLSKKECEFLSVLIKNDGNTLSRNALFSRVWGLDGDVEEASLDSYAHFIRRRLKKVSKRVTLVTVRGVGYRLEDIEC